MRDNLRDNVSVNGKFRRKSLTYKRMNIFVTYWVVQKQLSLHGQSLMSEINKEKNNTIDINLLDIIPEGVIIIDDRKTIEYANASALDMFKSEVKQELQDIIFSMEIQRHHQPEKTPQNNVRYNEPRLSNQSFRSGGQDFYAQFSSYNKIKIQEEEIKNANQDIRNVFNKSSSIFEQNNVQEENRIRIACLQEEEQKSPNRQKHIKITDLCSKLLQELQSINDEFYFFLYGTYSAVLQVQEETRVQFEFKIFYCQLDLKPKIIIFARNVHHREFIQTLQKYNEMKSNTLNFVSHEFRTPLGCIISYLEIIDLNKLQDKLLQDYISVALQNAKYLLNMSNDLLDLA